MENLRWIAREPHPVGTAAHAEVGRRLAREFEQLGLSVETQDGTHVDRRGDNRSRIVQVHNVLARLPGLRTSGSVLLMAHYDSAMGAPGAADDGVGIAVLLETARLLKSEAPLRNDVIFAATDAEEVGLFGARVFLAEHPWAHGIGALLNFEARGVSGPSILFETGERDGWLIRQFADAVPTPYGSSLAPALYEHMPNSTDLTVFKGTGVPRLNFAFAEGWQSYHTPRDTLERVDPASIQHDGSYAVALARRLGQLDLRQAAEDTSRLIYFNLGATIVRYDERAAIPVALVAVAVCVGFVAWRRRVDGLRGRDVIIGIVAAPLAVAATFGAARAAWWAVLYFDANRSALWEHAGLYMPAFVMLTTGVMLVMHRLLRRVASSDGLVVGAMVWFAIFSLCAAVWLPGASYVFAWPLVAAIVTAWGCRDAVRKDAFGPRHLLAISAGSLIVLLILVPTFRMTYLALPTLAYLSVPLMAVTFMLLISCIDLLAARVSWLVMTGVLCVATGLFGTAVVLANRAGRIERRSPGIYVASAESAHATWLSPDPRPISTGVQPVSSTDAEAIAAYIPAWYGESLRRSSLHLFEAPALSLPGPALSVDDDVLDGDTRILTLRLTSPRKAPEAGACFRSTQGLLRARSGRHPFNLPRTEAPTPASASASGDRCDLVVTTIGRAESGFPITVEIPAAASLDVQIIDRSYDLAGIEPWAAQQLPSPIALSAGAIVMTRRYHWSSPTRVVR